MALCRRIEKAAHVGDFLALFDDDRLRQTSELFIAAGISTGRGPCRSRPGDAGSSFG
jgi:hypothetical protein